MMKFFKKMKSKFKIGIGAMILGLFSWALVWAIGNIGTEVVADRDLVSLAIIGDTGIQSDQFAENNELLKRLAPQDVMILGDEAYDDGVKNQEDFDEKVRPLSNGYSRFWLVRGNHSYYTNHQEAIEKAVNATSDFRMPTGIIFNNACIALIESTLWEEVFTKRSDVERLKKKTEDYVLKWHEKCYGKIKIVGAHHCVYAQSGSHKGFRRKEYKALYDRLFANKINYFFCGHNHVVEDNGIHDSVHHFTSGGFAKDDSCKSDKCQESGFLMFNGKEVSFAN